MLSKLFSGNLSAAFFRWKPIFFILLLCVTALAVRAQTYDTISNWDGMVQNWVFSAGEGIAVINPNPDNVNNTGHCLKVKTTASQWDFFFYNFAVPADFDAFPRYRLKVLSPETGGKIAFKFENQDNSYSIEMVAQTQPGQWNDFTFDFSGAYYANLTRMVIFYDFNAIEPDNSWYFDDILKEIPDPPAFESKLPIVVVNTSGVAVPDEPKITATMGIVDNGPGSTNHTGDPFNAYNGLIGIEVRGQSSQAFPKKSYGFETRDKAGDDLKVALLGMPKESDWILYAPYTDKSLMRNVVTFELNRRMRRYGTRTIYCELILNGDYKGIYVMEEKIKRDKNRVDIAKLKPGDISGDALTGGYILSVDKLDPDFTYDYHGWLSQPDIQYPGAKNIIFQYYSPKPEELATQQRAYIRNFVDTASSQLASHHFRDPNEGYQKYFDVGSFIDFMLVNEISKEVDNYRYSTFLYKKRDSDGGKLFAGPIWDFNLGYGNVDFWPPGINISGWHFEMVGPVEWSIMFWWKRMMEDPYFHGLARARWHQLRQNELTNASVENFIDSLIVHTTQARERNFDRWKILGAYVWPNHYWQGNDYSDEVNYFKTFLFNRMNWMDNHFTADAVVPAAKIKARQNTISLELVDDFFANALLTPSHFSLNDAPQAVKIQSVEYISASKCLLFLNKNVEDALTLSVRISEKALNSWNDIISNTLGGDGLGDNQLQLEIRTKINNGLLQLNCTQPELLGDLAYLYNLNGQIIQQFRLQKQSQQTFSFNEPKGVYILQLAYANKLLRRKIVEIN